MPKKPSAKSADPSFMSVPAFWPMAMAAQLFEEGARLYAKNLRFVDEGSRYTRTCVPSLRHETRCDSICGPWCCASTASRAAFQR
jgi:hypothetical protein